MKITPRSILSLWKDSPDGRLSFSDIRKNMGAKKVQSEKLRTVIKTMVSAGQLEFDRRYYTLSEKSAHPLKKPVKPPRNTPQGGKHKEGDVYTGIFSAHPDGFGFVQVDAMRQSFFIPPKQIGGALDGDTVHVSLEPILPNTQTSGKGSNNKKKHDDKFKVRVQEVVSRKRRFLRGFVHMEHGRTWVMPLSHKIPPVFVEPSDDPQTYHHDDLVSVEITEFPEDAHTAPSGEIQKVIEDGDNPETIIEGIIADAGLFTGFSAENLDEMEELGSDDFKDGAPDRENLKKLSFVTIDGEDAKDFDDAVFLEKTKQNQWRLMVSIADVAEYVKPGMRVDEEAYMRGTSVYLPHMVLPMLPEALSNNLCSLRPRENRLTLTCEMIIAESGERISQRIFESEIHSKHRLTYAQVAGFLNSGDVSALGKEAKASKMLTLMGTLAETLKSVRKTRGAIDFEFPEPKFTLDDQGVPVTLTKSFPNVATKLIEQFMLEANETVAEHCTEAKIPLLYRVHDAPALDHLANLRVMFWNNGISVDEHDLSSPGGVNRLMEAIHDHPGREEMELSILKSMSQAQYRDKNDGHFGLAAPHYTHFTSPIRRYPDLLLHRALKSAIRSGETKRSQFTLPIGAGSDLSVRERTAGEVEGHVLRLYKVLYMEQFTGETFAAQVTSLSARGVGVVLRDHFANGFMPLALLRDDHYSLDSDRKSIKGRNSGRVVKFGTELQVQLARADRLTQELEFAFVSWEEK